MAAAGRVSDVLADVDGALAGQGLECKPDEGCPVLAVDSASDEADADRSGAGVAGCSSAGAVGVAGALFGAEVGAEGTVDSAPDVAVGGESDAGAFPPVGVVDGDPGACC
jgi:hypothetical protein